MFNFELNILEKGRQCGDAGLNGMAAAISCHPNLPLTVWGNSPAASTNKKKEFY
jgi:hypothetical protein